MRQGQVQGTEGRKAWRCAVLWQKTFCRCLAQRGHQWSEKSPGTVIPLDLPSASPAASLGWPVFAVTQAFWRSGWLFPCMRGCFTTSPLLLVPRDWSVSFFLSTACALKAYGERKEGKGKWQVCRVLNFLCAHPLISEAKEVCKCASGECWSWLVSTAGSHAPC